MHQSQSKEGKDPYNQVPHLTQELTKHTKKNITHKRNKGSALSQHVVTGVTTYVIAWMLQTRSMGPSLIYTVSFSLGKITQISVCQK